MSQLVAFQGMVRIEKKTKIRQLTAVVKGLRIYNWDCGRGGAGTFSSTTLCLCAIMILIQAWITFQVYSILRQKPQAVTSKVLHNTLKRKFIN